MKQFIFRGFLVLMCLVFGFSGSAQAFGGNDLNAINGQTPFYDPTDTSANCSAGSGALSGGERGQQIFNYLVEHGLSPVQTAGFMGNLYEESGLNPARVQNTSTPEGDRDNITIDDLTGYGLAQWTSRNRQQGLRDLAVSRGVKDSDLAMQLDYLWQELTTGYKKSTYEPLLNVTDIREATSLVMIKFEGPKDQSAAAQEKRAGHAIRLLAAHGSSAPAAASSSNSTTNSCGNANGRSDTANGNFSLPLPRKFYDQNKVLFTQPHHTYPAADIQVPVDTPVYAITGGKIIKAPVGGACGLGVMIEAEDGVRYLYCHGPDGGSVDKARQDDTVNAGDTIMHVGMTGRTSGPHLHVGITINGINHCPQNLFVGIVEGNIPNPKSLPTSGCVE